MPIYRDSAALVHYQFRMVSSNIPSLMTEGSQPLPPLPDTLGFSVVFLWQHDHWNQFSLNSPKNTISSMNI